MNLILEMPLRHRRPPQPEPQVNTLLHKVDVFYTVVDFEKHKPFYSVILPKTLTPTLADGILDVDGVTFAPDAWRMYTVKDYDDHYTGKRRA